MVGVKLHKRVEFKFVGVALRGHPFRDSGGTYEETKSFSIYHLTFLICH